MAKYTMATTADEFVHLEDGVEENYYGWKYMIMIIRLQKIKIYKIKNDEVSYPLKNSDKCLELDFKDIVKVIIANESEYSCCTFKLILGKKSISKTRNTQLSWLVETMLKVRVPHGV